MTKTTTTTPLRRVVHLLLLLTATTPVVVSAQQQQRVLSSKQRQRLLRSLDQVADDAYYTGDDNYDHDDDDDAATATNAESFSSTSIQFGTCYTDDYGNDIVQFQLCPVGSGCSDDCYGGRAYMANVAVLVSSFLNNDDDEDNNDDYNAQDNAATYAPSGSVGSITDPSVYRNCAAYDEKFYVGPFCQDEQIYLGYYWDAYCTQLLDDSLFSTLYGQALEYSVASGYSVMNATHACATCGDVDASRQGDNNEEQENNNQDMQDGDDAMQQDCEALIKYSLPLWGDAANEDADQEMELPAPWKTGILLGLVAMVVAVLVMGGLHAMGWYPFSQGGILTSFEDWRRRRQQHNQKKEALLATPFEQDTMAAVPMESLSSAAPYDRMTSSRTSDDVSTVVSGQEEEENDDDSDASSNEGLREDGGMDPSDYTVQSSLDGNMILLSEKSVGPS